MKFYRRAISGFAILFALLPAIRAQEFVPHTGYVYPAGGRQGATFQVVVGGQRLGGASDAYVSGSGVQAKVVEYNRPMTQKEFNEVRDELRALQEKRRATARKSQSSTNVWTAADEKRIAEIRNKILKSAPNRQGNPAIAETVTLQVTMNADTEAGEREIRLATPNGLSNPLLFCVGQLPEFSTPAAKAPNPDLERFRQQFGEPAKNTSAKPEMRVTMPAVVNGQIMPGQADRFRFTARKGQQLVAVVSARQLIPYLADAVPGWFQATLALYDSKGRELAYDDDFRFHPDPVVHFEIPKDGEYIIEIKDAIYRGREDFVYRIALGELPFVTGIFPMGAKADSRTTVEQKGWNLSTNTLSLNVKDIGTFPIPAGNNGLILNHVPFAVDTLPECFESEPNNSIASAQSVAAPVIVNGRIDPPGDWDVFRLEGRAGDELVAEVHARRLDSPLDSVLKLTDATGRQLAFNDDLEDKGSGLTTHHADSYLRATLPSDGVYYIHLGDAQRKGGEEYAYRLHISPPRPDFELRAVPSSINARAGVSAPFTVFALRKDGFTNEITLELKDAPNGFKLDGGVIPANQDRIQLTLTASTKPLNAPARLVLEGRAIIRGAAVFHPAVPADDMMQAFAYRHLVPAKEMLVAVSGRWTFKSPVKISGEMPVKIPAGGTAQIRIVSPSGSIEDRFQLELNEPPDGIVISKVSPTDEGAEIVFRADAEKVKPGLKGNLIVNIFGGRNFGPAGKQKQQPAQRRTMAGSLPAIPFEIVGQKLAQTGP